MGKNKKKSPSVKTQSPEKKEDTHQVHWRVPIELYRKIEALSQEQFGRDIQSLALELLARAMGYKPKLEQELEEMKNRLEKLLEKDQKKTNGDPSHGTGTHGG